MKKIVYIFLLTVCAFNINSQNLSWDWAKGFGTSQGEQGQNIAHDKDGNIYLTGYFQGDSLRMGSYKLTKPSFYLQALFIAKVDTAGNVLWAKTAMGEANSYAIAVDSNNNVIIGGSFFTSINFGSSIFLNNSGGSDIYIAKYDTNGNILWAKQAGSTKTDYCLGLGVDKLGNIYSTGTICDGGSVYAVFGSIILNNDNSLGDIYIAKYDANGNVIWANNYGGLCTAYSHYLTATSNGDFYISGYFFNSHITFDNFTLTNSGNTDAFIVKFDSTGKAKWANKVGGSSGDYAGNLATDNLDNVYFTGNFSSPSVNINGTTLFNSGASDAFVCSYNFDGNLNWAKKIGGNLSDGAQAVSCDLGSNVYFTSIFQSATIMVGANTFTNNGVRNVLVTKYNASGNLLGAISGGGIGNEAPWASIINDDALYIFGNTIGTQANYGNSTYISAGNSDLLLSKLHISNGCSSISSLLKYSCGVDSMVSPSGHFVYYNTGTYYDTIPNSNSCDSIITVAFIKYSIDKTISDTSMLFFGGHLLEANETSGDSYQWLNCMDMSAINSETLATLFVTNSGNYSTIIKKHGCVDTTNCILVCKPTNSTINISSCHNYTVPSGHQVYSSSGVYADTLHGIFTCDSIITIYLNITPANAVASYSANFNPSDTLMLDVTDLSSGNITGYLWDFGDGNTSTLPNPQHIYDSIGHYQICLTVYDDSLCLNTYCDSTINFNRIAGIKKINIINPLITNISKLNPQGILKVFPNPTSGNITLKSDNKIGKLEITNMLGQIIYNNNIDDKMIEVLLPNENGMYFIQVKNNNDINTIKVIKQ